MSAQKELENYSKSIQYSIGQAKASLQELATDILDSKVLKGIVDIFTIIIQGLDKIIDHPLIALLLGGGTAGVVELFRGGKDIANILAPLTKLVETGNTLSRISDVVGKAYAGTAIEVDMLSAATKSLTLEQTAQILSLKGLNKEQIKEILMTKVSSAEDLDKVNSLMAEIGATNGLTFSLKGLNVALAENIKLLAAWLVTNPIGWAVLVAGAIAGTIAIFDVFTESLDEQKEKYEEISQEAESAKSKLESLESELSSINNQIKELQSKGTLTLSEQDDLNRLISERENLELMASAQERIAQAKAREQLYANTKVFSTEYNNSQYVNGGMQFANEYVENKHLLEQYQKNRDEWQRKLDEENSKGSDANTKRLEKYKDKIEELNEEIDNLTGGYFNQKELELLELKQQFETSGDGYENKVINGVKYQDVINQLKEIKTLTGTTGEWNEMQISSVADELGLTEEELSKLAETGVNTLDVVDGLTEGMKDADLIIEDGESELSIFNKYLADYKKNIDSASDSTESWSSTLSSALKKLGESDEDFKKYVETLKELNPSLADNQENLEKVALVNLQFSKASEDLQSNFEKYKQILSEDNELSVEYANTISSLADDLTYLTGVDFDIAKTQEWTKSAENVKLLEEALNGSEQALANLRESVQSSEDAIEQAIRDGRRINELQDVQIELGLNTDEFNTELVNLVEWMDNTDLGTITAFADLNDAPFLQKLLELASKSEETATALKAMFNDLGWDIEWDTTQMMVPNANGGNVAGGIPSDVASKLRGYNANTNSVHYDLVPMDVPTNIHFTNKKNNASFVNKNTPKSIPKSSGGSSGGGGGSKDSETEPKEEVFDWIEVNIKRLEEAIDRLDKKVNASYKNWYDRMHAIPEELSYVLGEIQTQETAYSRYMQQANSVGLAEPYAALVRQGGMDISTITDENLANQIKQYQEYYEKAQSCADKVEDLKQKVADLAKQRFDNLVKQFDDVIERVTHAQDLINTMIETTKAQGYIVGTTYYSTLIDMENNHLQKLEREYKDLKNAQAEAVQIGAIEEYSQTWNEMQSQIESVESAIYGAKKAIVEYKNELRQVEWDLFDRKQDYISLIKDESDWLQELLRTEHKITDETSGRLNNYGKSIGALQVVDYQTSMEQARRYADEIKKINEEVAKDPYNTKLIDRKNELIKAQREAIKAAEDEKKAIHDLIQESYQEMLRILQELINKRKEALDAEKDLYDYKNNVQEQADNISSIQKQIMSLQGDDSEENQARLQTLVTNLKEAQRELQDTEYNKWLTDQKRMMDDLYSSAEELLNERLDNIDGLLEEMIETTNINKDEIKETIEQEALTVGYTITEETQNILNGLTYNADILLSVGDVVNQICVFVDAMRSFSENIAINIATMIANNLAAHNDDVHNASLIVNAINNAATQVASSVGAAFNRLQTELANTKAALASAMNNSGSGASNNSNVHVSYIPGTGQTVHWTGSAKSGIHIRYAEGGIIGKPAHFAKTDNSTNDSNVLGKTSNLKKARYAKGGTIGSEIRSLGEDGIILARSGEEVLSLEKVKGMKDVLQAFEPLAMAVTKLPSATNNTTNLGNNEINVSFTLPNVTNYEEFIQTAKTDARFEKIIQQMTFGNALGGNSLKKYTL